MPSSQLISDSTVQLFLGVFRGKRVLVTGHTGFKGSWLCEWLLSLGAKVTGFALPPATRPALFDQIDLASRIRHVIGDVTDPDAVKNVVLQTQPDFVFHLAAQPLVRLSYREPVETWQTNVMGTINVLEALRCYQNGLMGATDEEFKGSGLYSAQRFSDSTIQPHNPCVAVMVTTDKVYENREWTYGYREEDPLGGYDPYSSSKGAAEIAIASWRRSFFQSPSTSNRQPAILIASARAGNVIGGGDWAEDRIVPDAMRALAAGVEIPVRNKHSTRPWQHVLEPLSGYLSLAAALATHRVQAAASGGVDRSSFSVASSKTGQDQSTDNESLAALCSAFNFGPALDSNRPVEALVTEILQHWPGRWEDRSDPLAPHEAGKLNLTTDKAFHLLGWQPKWKFSTTIEKTAIWYRSVFDGANVLDLTQHQISEYAESQDRNI